MAPKSESPAADGTANGAEIESGTGTSYTTPAAKAATLSRLRAAHIAAVCGVSDHRAAMISAFIFAELAQ